MAVQYLDIGDRIKMILDKHQLDETTWAMLAGAIAFHLEDYAEQRIDDVRKAARI